MAQNFAALLKIHFQFIRTRDETAVIQPFFIEVGSEKKKRLSKTGKKEEIA